MLRLTRQEHHVSTRHELLKTLFVRETQVSQPRYTEVMAKKSQHILPELPWSWHRSRGWEGHWARVRRWHDRVVHAKRPDDVEDYLYAFFQNCSVLRDWLPPERFPPADVDAFFREHLEMRLCRDIGNMTKHRRLTRSATGMEPSLAREYQPRAAGTFDRNSSFIVLSQGEKHDLRDIATCCLKRWEEFFALPRSTT